MNNKLVLLLALTFSARLISAFDKEISNFPAYVDSDVCARLMLGPISSQRVECSQKTYKEGAGLVLVRLSNNMVLNVNKEKMLKDLVGQLASVSGELKV